MNTTARSTASQASFIWPAIQYTGRDELFAYPYSGQVRRDHRQRRIDSLPDNDYSKRDLGHF